MINFKEMVWFEYTSNFGTYVIRELNDGMFVLTYSPAVGENHNVSFSLEFQTEEIAKECASYHHYFLTTASQRI